MTLATMIPLLHCCNGSGASGDIWFTGAVVFWVLSAFTWLGYLVMAAKPDGGAAMVYLMIAMGAGLAWPAIAILPLVGLVLGVRWMIHGSPQGLSKESRRNARIRRMEQRTAELEKELQL